jgi:CRISPR-associated protein Csb1
LKSAVAGNVAAIRRITKLQPAGGDGDKVFPPTYEGGEYAIEERHVRATDGAVQTVATVLLDSVQSQANRLELALLGAYRKGRLKFPLLSVDFTAKEFDPIIREIGRISSLEAPHRIADAIFRDSLLEGKPFRKSSHGLKFTAAKPANATPLFELCPTALVFGVWDSTGPKGGLGAKFQRALVSEIVGFRALSGVRPSSRIDPLQIECQGVKVYKKSDDPGYTTELAKAEKNKDGEPIEVKATELNHGNITPSLRDKNGNLNPGGFALDYAVQTTVLSLSALRRLAFPLNGAPNSDHAVNRAAQATLAALALAAICLHEEDGYDLRSRCVLDGEPGPFEMVGQGKTNKYSLSANQAAELLAAAAQEAHQLGLPWSTTEQTLTPCPEFVNLILKSRNKTATAAAGVK